MSDAPPTEVQQSDQQDWRATIQTAVFRPVAVMPLVWFRIVFAGTLLYWAWHYYASGLIEQFYIAPRFHFTWPFFGWIRPLPGHGMYVVFGLIAISAVCVMLGLFYRLSAAVLGLLFVYVFLIDKAYYQNHYYLLSMTGLLMPLLPCHHSMSLDALFRPKLRTHVVPMWSLFLIRFAVGLPYFFGGIAKITPDWLAGQPMRMMLSERTWMPIVGQWFTDEWMVMSFVWGGLLLDLLIVPALLWRKTRWMAVLFGLGFHVSNALMFHIGVFPWFMILATFVFFPAVSFPRIFRMGSLVRNTDKMALPSVGMQRCITVCLIVFAVVQCLLPFRHHFYNGQVKWNEHGHHFSWRMKLRGKQCALRLHAFDEKSGATSIANPARWLSAFQINRMARDPGMVHQFARFLGQQYSNQGYSDTQIHAIVMCSLNGRKPQLLIDPEVDLAAVPVALSAPAYVLPLTEPLPHDQFQVPRQEWEQFVPARYRMETRRRRPVALRQIPLRNVNDDASR